MSFTADELRELPVVISEPRFGTYLAAAGEDVAGGLALYHWNLAVSAAFIVPLQLCEVAIRNAVVEVLERVHGADWPWSNGFARSLPRSATGYNPENNLRAVARRHRSAGQVVAALHFAFWGALFTAGQDGRLWEPWFRAAFPGSPALLPIAVARAAFYADLSAIRTLRNRIAHHEPIFTRDILAEYNCIQRLVRARNPVASVWLHACQGVTRLAPMRPRLPSAAPGWPSQAGHCPIAAPAGRRESLAP